MSRLFNRAWLPSKGYRHFNSHIDDFYLQLSSLSVASVNNHALNLNRLGPRYRVTRFIRDPRDLIVSGYHYHRRGAEDWCHIIDPNEHDFSIVNGAIPENLPPGTSMASFLQQVKQEEGLIAEIQFRARHFESMRQWPEADRRIKLYRYEEIIGREPQTFESIAAFYGLGWPRRKLAGRYARKYAASNVSGTTSHIRNASPNQWKSAFTPRVEAYFNERYSDIIERYGYDT